MLRPRFSREDFIYVGGEIQQLSAILRGYLARDRSAQCQGLNGVSPRKVGLSYSGLPSRSQPVIE